ncbi:MAG: CDP-alcohol phosphatidyltransferase family protein [Gemmatimonadota bacterium]
MKPDADPGVSSEAGEIEHGFLTAANILSLSRIPLGILFLAFSDQFAVALIVAAGALTDLLDGWIARITGTTSEIGALLDPFCDRIFVLLGLISFLPTGHLDWAGMLVLILRDLYTGGVYLVQRVAGRLVPFQSRPLGKITTALQILALFTLIFRPELINGPIVLVGVASVMAIIDYGMSGLRPNART